jgi:hypothetical protein
MGRMTWEQVVKEVIAISVKLGCGTEEGVRERFEEAATKGWLKGWDKPTKQGFTRSVGFVLARVFRLTRNDFPSVAKGKCVKIELVREGVAACVKEEAARVAVAACVKKEASVGVTDGESVGVSVVVTDGESVGVTDGGVEEPVHSAADPSNSDVEEAARVVVEMPECEEPAGVEEPPHAAADPSNSDVEEAARVVVEMPECEEPAGVEEPAHAAADPNNSDVVCAAVGDVGASVDETSHFNFVTHNVYIGGANQRCLEEARKDGNFKSYAWAGKIQSTEQGRELLPQAKATPIKVPYRKRNGKPTRYVTCYVYNLEQFKQPTNYLVQVAD